MKIESHLLRSRPKFEIILHDNSFQIFNDADTNDNGTFDYSLIDTLELKTQKINWFVSGLSFAFEFFMANASLGDFYRDKNKLIFTFNQKKKIILLNDCDMEKTKWAIQRLNQKLAK